jgi:hypothetical protein
LEIGSTIREAWESINRAVAEEEVLGDVIQSIYNELAAEQLPTPEMEIREKDTEMEEQGQRAMKAATNRLGPVAEHMPRGVLTIPKSWTYFKREHAPQGTSSHTRFWLLLLPSP